MVHDVSHDYAALNYHFVAPVKAIRQTLFAINHVLLSFHRDSFVLPMAPPVQAALRYVVEHLLVLPLALAAVALWRRERTIGLGLAWILITLAPVVWLDYYHASRYYYLPAFGSALILAHCGGWAWDRASAAAGYRRPLRLALACALAYLVVVNLSMTTLVCLRDREDTQRIAEAFHVLQGQRGQVPGGSLVVLRNSPPSCFSTGIGVVDMVRMALEDPFAHGILEGQRLPDMWLRRLSRISSVYLLDCAPQPPVLRRIPRARPAKGAAVLTFPTPDVVRAVPARRARQQNVYDWRIRPGAPNG
jgi:hypothetical protein